MCIFAPWETIHDLMIQNEYTYPLMTRLTRFVLILLSLLAVHPVTAQEPAVIDKAKETTPCPFIKMEVERLPDLNIPRSGHEVLAVGGEYVVFGGHTSGFVPTPTAEYFKDGQWHLMKMVYNHDFGTSVKLKSGKVLLAGGAADNIGVGQTYTAELYDPQSHTFDGFGSMDIKRAKLSALELDSEKVVIAGNWLHDDAIEQYDGKTSFTYVKDVRQHRSFPYIIRIAKDDALIIGSRSNKNEKARPVADRLKGDTINIPLLETWHPFPERKGFSTESFIGDESQGIYSYLIPVEDDNGQVAIMKVENGRFSLLPTVCPIPMRSQFGGIWYFTSVIVDRQIGRAYLIGVNSDLRTNHEAGYRYYVLGIDYAHASDKQPAPLMLYYTDLIPDFLESMPIVTNDGDLLMAGGMKEISYFKPSNMAYLLLVGNHPSSARSESSWYLPVVISLGIVVLICCLSFLLRRRTRSREVAVAPEVSAVQTVDSDLMSRICELMESQKLYLNSGLKITDIALALGVNRYYISDCINSTKGCSFSQFVNSYRIEHAKRMLSVQPDIKLSEVWMSSGFSTERTFLRAFKAITGMTPSEFKGKND